MAINKSQISKEIIDTILNIIKRGLHDSKHFKADGTFSLPTRFYQDAYISGFVQHFITVTLNNRFGRFKLLSKDELGELVLNIYKGINLTDEDINSYKKLISDKEFQKDWNVDGNYVLGKIHAKLCIISKSPIALGEQKDGIIFEAKKKVLEEGVTDNEDYDLKMTAAIYELTIYNYLKSKFGNIKNSKVDNIIDKSKKDIPSITNNDDTQILDKTSKIQNAESINDLPYEYYEEYKERKKKYELENPYPKHGAALYGILFGVGSMMLISVILTLNYIENEFQAVIGGFLIGGIAYFAQHQNEKNHSLKRINEMNKIEKEIIERAKQENQCT